MNDGNEIDFDFRLTVAEGDEDNQSAFAVGVTKVTIDRILSLSEHRADVLALYLFFAYTARWKHSQDIWATNHYAANALGWGTDKVSRMRKILVTLGLIKRMQMRDERGRTVRWLVRVNYLVKVQNLISPGLVNSYAKEEELVPRKKEVQQFSESVDFQDEELQAEWAAFQHHRQEKRNALTVTARGRAVKKLRDLGKVRALAALRHSIEQGYTGIFEPKATRPRDEYGRVKPPKTPRELERERIMEREHAAGERELQEYLKNQKGNNQ